ncbi:hypothetical protein DDI_3118 [Dickeya dianthicola RNS04.9]|nr:hypothetical protein DDI_3118 [Dickeya dianthicola RNS04.9]
MLAEVDTDERNVIPFRKKNTLSAYRSQGRGDHLINRRKWRFFIYQYQEPGACLLVT